MSTKDPSSKAPSGYDFRRAFSSLRKLIANPDDTAHVFTIIESLSGKAPLRMLERFRSDPGGARLLASRTNILRLLADRAWLESLPANSLGSAYLAFIDSEGITADGLVEASHDGETGAWRKGDDFEYVSDRMRDTHDLWHTVTGYHGDVLGEASLLAFSVAQTRNPGVALIVLGALGRTRDLEFAKMVWNGLRAGERAVWLPALEWEALLPLPIDEVRRRLSIEKVAPYVEMRSSWLRETGQLAAAA